MTNYNGNIARLFLLEVHYRISKGWAASFGPHGTEVLPEPDTEVLEWRPSSVFESRGAACEYAFDRGYVDYRVSEITLNPTTPPRDHREIFP